jgi:hypothetical protein
MIAELEQIIQTEEAKPEAERDADLIDECIREIAELKSVRSDYSDEEIDRITDNLVKATEREKKRKRFIRLAAGIAAAFVIISGVTACANNPALINWLAKVVRMPFGSSIDSGKVTYTNQGITQKYKSITDFLESNKLNFYYPSILPDDSHLVSIDHYVNDNQNLYTLSYSLPDLYFTVETKFEYNRKWGEFVTEIECNDLFFNVYKEENLYFAVCESDEVRYILQCNNQQDIILIIGGLTKTQE